MNPLLQPFTAPFEAPPFDRIREEHYLPAIEDLIRQAEQEISLITDSPESPTFANTIVPLERSGERLGIISSILFNLNHAETGELLQRVAQEASPLLTEYSNRLMMNEGLFERVRVVHEGTGAQVVEEGTVLGNWYRDFVRNGALLKGDDKKRFAEIRTRLAKLTLEFADHVLAETNDFVLHITDEEDLEGLPGYVVDTAAQEAREAGKEGWVFSLHAPSMVPFMKFSARRHLREKLHRAYAFRCNRGNEHDNKERVREIVNLRLELANLLGYREYASYKLETKMALNTGRVTDLLEKLH
ncbi:MAG: M3 family metallopeptidase, partial [Bacteroidales bacterium]